MMMVPMTGAAVENIKYVTEQPEGAPYPINAMRFDLANGEHVYVPNGGWTTKNPALCVLAFLGLKPSEIDEAEGAFLPFVVTPGGELAVPAFVVQQGRHILENAEWFEPESTEGKQIDLQDGGAVDGDFNGPAA